MRWSNTYFENSIELSHPKRGVFIVSIDSSYIPMAKYFNWRVSSGRGGEYVETSFNGTCLKLHQLVAGPTINEASIAYLSKAKELFGEFARA